MNMKSAITKIVRPKGPDYPFSSYWQPLFFLLFLCSVGSVLIFSSGCSLPKSTSDKELANSISAPEIPATEKYMSEGSLSFQHGAFEDAISNWTEAFLLFEKEVNTNKQCEALIKLSQAYQSVGQYGKALKSLERALSLAKESDDKDRIASTLGYLGNLHIAIGQADMAEQYLNEGLTMARDMGDSGLEATILNNLGNLFASQKRYEDAVYAYKESMLLSKKTGNHLMTGIALSNAAMASIRKGEYDKARPLLDKALHQVRNLDDSYYKAYGLINIGLAYRDLRPHFPESNERLLVLASEMFNEAFMVAENIGDPRTASFALGYLGNLYEDQHRYQEALQLTRRAVFSAQRINAPESLYRWQWQMGRLLNALRKTDDAISAYRRSVYTLQSIRQEMSGCYANPESSFRQTAGSVCFELVDLLLQRAATLPERDKYEPYLIEAREAVELLKVFELRDYFQDDCVDTARSVATKLDVVSQTAVVVYPILLQDRMELLVSLPKGLKRFSVQVRADTITQEVRKFRRKLEKRTTGEFLPHAQKLYDWVIRPLEGDLASIAIDTLVFVPDGPLRTIPMAALHDGKRFLINKYAIAITPGLDLTDPRSIERENVKVLALGITESVQGFPPLPYVSVELQAIQELYGGSRLLNEDFLLTNMERELRDEQFNIVHIASHGQFGANVDETFVLSFDDKLTIDRLGQLVGLFRFRDDPLDLLTLSACETAAGDDRAALGLAGIAIRAGARSALATLWHINDPASSKLVAEFYRQLDDPSISRAAALQAAQLKVLADPRYEHPGYWSPFLLINNWL